MALESGEAALAEAMDIEEELEFAATKSASDEIAIRLTTLHRLLQSRLHRECHGE